MQTVLRMAGEGRMTDELLRAARGEGLVLLVALAVGVSLEPHQRSSLRDAFELVRGTGTTAL